jgi:hypothetical protein
MVTVAVDLNGDSFPNDIYDGQDVTDICPPTSGIKPDKLIIKYACGAGGGNPDCLATFEDERKARVWFAIITDTPHEVDPNWFDENVVA